MLLADGFGNTGIGKGENKLSRFLLQSQEHLGIPMFSHRKVNAGGTSLLPLDFVQRQRFDDRAAKENWLELVSQRAEPPEAVFACAVERADVVVEAVNAFAPGMPWIDKNAASLRISIKRLVSPEPIEKRGRKRIRLCESMHSRRKQFVFSCSRQLDWHKGSPSLKDRKISHGHEI